MTIKSTGLRSLWRRQLHESGLHGAEGSISIQPAVEADSYVIDWMNAPVVVLI